MIRRTVCSLSACLLLVACSGSSDDGDDEPAPTPDTGPSADTSPVDDTTGERRDGATMDAGGGDAGTPDAGEPKPGPGPCALRNADNGEVFATYFYDEEGRLSGVLQGDDAWKLNYQLGDWARTGLYECSIDADSRSARKQAFDACRNDTDPIKNIGYTYDGDSLTSATVEPSVRGGKVAIEYQYDNDRLSREARSYPEGPPMRLIKDLDYSWSSGRVELTPQPGSSSDAYDFDDSIPTAHAQTVCFAHGLDRRALPRGRCLALADNAPGAAVRMIQSDGTTLQFEYDDNGRLTARAVEGGATFEASYACRNE
jgi:YD repeat-containing protein